MQYELRTQVIEPQRKTFQHLIDRYGDRPASRYEEGTIGLQPKENFHYRPTWAPDKELYDPAYSVLRLFDPYAFTDPRQFYYTPYVTARAGMHEAFGKTLDYLEGHNLFERLPEPWRRVMAEAFIPLRHLESGAQMVLSGAARFGYGTTITQCCAYAAFDRMGNAQLISRVGIALGGGTAELLDAGKGVWMDGDHLQGLRRYIEECVVEEDWGKGLVGLDILDQLLYGLLYRNLDEEALLGGAAAFSLVAQHLSGWAADQRRWLDALYKAWRTDPEHGDANTAVIAEVGADRLPKATEATKALAAFIDSQVGVGAEAGVDALAAAIAGAHGVQEGEKK